MFISTSASLAIHSSHILSMTVVVVDEYMSIDAVRATLCPTIGKTLFYTCATTPAEDGDKTNQPDPPSQTSS